MINQWAAIIPSAPPASFSSGSIMRGIAMQKFKRDCLAQYHSADEAHVVRVGDRLQKTQKAEKRERARCLQSKTVQPKLSR
jgi:hypothetical protein